MVMKMCKMAICVVVISISFTATLSLLFAPMVYAAEPMVRITEILYDAEGRDNGKEYVEVVNTGPGEIDMTAVKFFERDDRSTGRTIEQGTGSTVLQPGDIAVIVADPTLFSSNYNFDGCDT